MISGQPSASSAARKKKTQSAKTGGSHSPADARVACTGELRRFGRRTDLIWGAIILVGILARLWLWWNFTGDDSHVWAGHAAHIAGKGLALTYEERPSYNHPPLMGYLASLWFYLAGAEKPDILAFARWFKLPALAGELGATALLWRFASPVAAAIYALSPVAILISAFQGNTDALGAAFVLAGVIAASRERWVTSGGLFAAAANVKLIPLLLMPVVVRSATWRTLPRFLAGLAVGAIPFLISAMSAATAMRRNLLDYVPPVHGWGVMGFLGSAKRVPHLEIVMRWEAWYSANGRFIVFGSILLFAIWAKHRSRLGVAEKAAVALALWLILTPRFGIQYLIYILPVLCLVNRYYAVLWSCLAGAVLAASYWTAPANPVPAAGTIPLFGVLAWAMLVHFVLVTTGAIHGRRPAAQDANASARV